MIYDCFTFFNELELLELRLNELTSVVDKFVLVESTRTFTNKLKPLYFQENRARFATFADKIIHVAVHDSPDISDPWAVEHFQRNAIARGLMNCRLDDFVLVSDLDEIPRATAVESVSCQMPRCDDLFCNAIHGALSSKLSQNIFRRKGFRRLLRKNHPFVWRFEQTRYRHFINCRAAGVSHGTRMMRFRDFTCAEELRHSGRKTIKDAGWHFTWMGGVERIQKKLAAYSHQENNLPEFADPEYLARTISAGNPLFNKGSQLTFVPVDDSLPRYILDHPEKFSKWIKSL